MNGDVLVSLLETVVFLDVMQVISADNHCPVHLHLGDNSSQDAASDRDLTGEGALLVDVVTFAGLSYKLHILVKVSGKVPGFQHTS